MLNRKSCEMSVPLWPYSERVLFNLMEFMLIRLSYLFTNIDRIYSCCRIPAAGFPAMVHGHHMPTQSTPHTVANSVTYKRKQHGTERSNKSGSKRAKK